MNGSSSLENNIKPSRIVISFVILLAIIIIFIIRLFNLQILQGQENLAEAEENRTSNINLQAMRGIIYDRNGIILARNIPSYNVVITAANLPDDPGAVQSIIRTLSVLTGVPETRGELSQTDPYVPCQSDHGISQIFDYGFQSSPYKPVQLVCDIDELTAKIVQEKAVDLPGVSIEIQPIREYPTGDITASIIGFLGPVPASQEDYYTDLGFVPNRDKVGYAGVEFQYQDILGGKNGKRVIEVDVAGQILRDLETPIQPEAGNNIKLTIDTRFQQVVEAIFRKEITEWNLYFNNEAYTSGVVIAINPSNGEILAMVSYPSYENNRMSRVIPAYYYNQLLNDPTNPLLNHAVGDVLPAGSVFKLVTSVGALNEGVVDFDQIIKTPPEILITEKFYANDPGSSRRFVEWNTAGFGELDFVHGLANSSNVYFYKLGGGYKEEIPDGGLGICRLGTYARALGYGDAPGINLPDEQKGLIPDPQWKRVTHSESWSTGDTYITSVGQGYILATPLQVLLSASIIANDGVYVQPTLIKEISDSDGNIIHEHQPEIKWDITKDPIIQEFGPTTIRGCEPTGNYKTVQPWVIKKIQEGMRLAVIEGTLSKENIGMEQFIIAIAGKTGTAEYCDKYAAERNLCKPGAWPSHAWTVAYAPYENPEIAVIAFVYNGNEGATVAGPIVNQVIRAYFQLKSAYTASTGN